MYYKYLKSLGKFKGVDKPPFYCYTISINNKEREIIMEKIVKTFEMKDKSGKKNPIRFISAHKGGIMMYSNPGELVAWAKTPEMITYALRTKGADDVIMGSSSMDFASEEGFKNNEDAMTLWNEGYEKYLDEVITVGVKPENINYGSAI
tara:strand:+ start:96 stop:542 length:447 start_codon:yes stop_codon:yes gene_type:complete